MKLRKIEKAVREMVKADYGEILYQAVDKRYFNSIREVADEINNNDCHNLYWVLRAGAEKIAKRLSKKINIDVNEMMKLIAMIDSGNKIVDTIMVGVFVILEELSSKK